MSRSMDNRSGVVRRFARFRLRTFLLVILLTGVCSGVFGSRVLYIARIMANVPEIEKYGGHVYSDFYGRYGLYPPERNARNTGLMEWVTSNPVDVSLLAHQESDSQALMQLVGDIKTVRRLRVIRIGDHELRHVARLGNLESVHIEDSVLSDRGLTLLTAMPNLREITLLNVKVVDTGLWHRGRLSNLGKIRIRQSIISPHMNASEHQPVGSSLTPEGPSIEVAQFMERTSSSMIDPE